MNPVFLAYALLALAIVSEVTGSTFLVKSEDFTKLVPSILVFIFYVISFYLLSHVLKTIPLGIAYAIWSGIGIILTACIGFFVFRQSLNLPAVIGFVMIMGGVIVMNVFSKSVGH
ncbi:DMT family transporter [Acinetobacter terrestris]|uniref:Multidrug efflux SMR transporter n=1 Tax=Acinetobacter terrestris TaxID=2529843 RepID=A0AAW6UV94_9GAMM|nr:multidrug efflux SMR transporter [Acinetobacter terrestris]MDK1683585.1 multidrug efflux SMR transporter [Acinetobacter terrestris]